MRATRRAQFIGVFVVAMPVAAQMSRPASLISKTAMAVDSSKVSGTTQVESETHPGSTTNTKWSATLPGLEGLTDYLVAIGWVRREESTASPAGLAVVRTQTLERDRPLSRNIGLRPILTIATIDYPDRADVPDGNGNQFQRWSRDEAMEQFAPLLERAGITTPAVIRAVRRGPRIYLVVTEGHVFIPIAGDVSEDVRQIVSANPGRSRSSLVEGRIKDQQERARVTEAQELLRDLGFYDEGLDGTWGSKSRAGMLAFQDISGIPVTGEPDDHSLAVLRQRHQKILGN